jgi:hypothetical protein
MGRVAIKESLDQTNVLPQETESPSRTLFRAGIFVFQRRIGFRATLMISPKVNQRHSRESGNPGFLKHLGPPFVRR